jgi:hypothetical protein
MSSVRQKSAQINKAKARAEEKLRVEAESIGKKIDELIEKVEATPVVEEVAAVEEAPKKEKVEPKEKAAPKVKAKAKAKVKAKASKKSK